MKSTKKLGIWMDYSVAHLMKLSNDTIVASTLELGSSYPAKEQNLGIHERLFHDKEQKQLSAYFSRLGDIIRDYDDVILFGPTVAKSELLNILKGNHDFDKINIELKTVDRMTENQKQAFVKEYFHITD
jgi:hypothetical protein